MLVFTLGSAALTTVSGRRQTMAFAEYGSVSQKAKRGAAIRANVDMDVDASSAVREALAVGGSPRAAAPLQGSPPRRVPVEPANPMPELGVEGAPPKAVEKLEKAEQAGHLETFEELTQILDEMYDNNFTKFRVAFANRFSGHAKGGTCEPTPRVDWGGISLQDYGCGAPPGSPDGTAACGCWGSPFRACHQPDFEMVKEIFSRKHHHEVLEPHMGVWVFREAKAHYAGRCQLALWVVITIAVLVATSCLCCVCRCSRSCKTK